MAFAAIVIKDTAVYIEKTANVYKYLYLNVKQCMSKQG